MECTIFKIKPPWIETHYLHNFIHISWILMLFKRDLLTDRIHVQKCKNAQIMEMM